MNLHLLLRKKNRGRLRKLVRLHDVNQVVIKDCKIKLPLLKDQGAMFSQSTTRTWIHLPQDRQKREEPRLFLRVRPQTPTMKLPRRTTTVKLRQLSIRLLQTRIGVQQKLKMLLWSRHLKSGLRILDAVSGQSPKPLLQAEMAPETQAVKIL